MIQREEVIGDCRLIQGDCREIMPTLGRVDAVVTDPPYGIGYMHGAEKRKYASRHNEMQIIGDDKPFDPTPFLQFPCLMWGANHFAAKLPGGGALDRMGQARRHRVQRSIGCRDRLDQRPAPRRPDYQPSVVGVDKGK